jgi:RHS repeat-associated protein
MSRMVTPAEDPPNLHSFVRIASGERHWLVSRRHDVPAGMHQAALARRLAGDWRGACVAARLDVRLDLAQVSREHGAEVAGQVADDLHHLAPDLVRWHLAQTDREDMNDVLVDRLVVVFARYGASTVDDQGAPALWLWAARDIRGLPRWPQLRFGPATGDEARSGGWERTRYLWDVRATGDLLGRVGGGDRTPFFGRDGRLLADHELPAARPPDGDSVALAEWVMILQDRGLIEQAWADGGLPITLDEQGLTGFNTPEIFATVPALVTELRRVAAEHREDQYVLRDLGARSRLIAVAMSGARMTAAMVRPQPVAADPSLPRVCWQRLRELDLLRLGWIELAGLHPLVRSALFPEASDVDYQPCPPVPVEVPVPCRGGVHRVGWRAGRAVLFDHALQERDREQAMSALGGKASPCFAVEQQWRSAGWHELSPELAELRGHALAAMIRGDEAELVRLLDLGLDPTGMFDSLNRGPLHLLAFAEAPQLPTHAAPGLVAGLVAAGLGINAPDSWLHRPPLGWALWLGGSAALVHALLDAGADPTFRDRRGRGALHLLRSVEAAAILPRLLVAGSAVLAGSAGVAGSAVLAGSAGVAGSYTYTARGTLSAVVTGATTTTTTNDAFGQTITQGTRTYSYDALGRMIGATGGTAVTLSYTGLTNTPAYDGTTRYSRDPNAALVGASTGSSGVYAWTDTHLDVVGAYTATATTLAGSAAYNPLGAVIATTGMTGGLGYQSGWTETATGRVNMAARWYNPAVGQFDNRDTADNSPTPNSAAANPFAYGGGNPLTHTDVSGRQYSDALDITPGNRAPMPATPPQPPSTPKPSSAPKPPSSRGHQNDPRDTCKFDQSCGFYGAKYAPVVPDDSDDPHADIADARKRRADAMATGVDGSLIAALGNCKVDNSCDTKAKILTYGMVDPARMSPDVLARFRDVFGYMGSADFTMLDLTRYMQGYRAPVLDNNGTVVPTDVNGFLETVCTYAGGTPDSCAYQRYHDHREQLAKLSAINDIVGTLSPGGAAVTRFLLFSDKANDDFAMGKSSRALADVADGVGALSVGPISEITAPAAALSSMFAVASHITTDHPPIRASVLSPGVDLWAMNQESLPFGASPATSTETGWPPGSFDTMKHYKVAVPIPMVWLSLAQKSAVAQDFAAALAQLGILTEVP